MNGFNSMVTVAAHQAHAENIKKSERARLAQAARQASGTRSLRQRFNAMLVRAGSRPVNEVPSDSCAPDRRAFDGNLAAIGQT